MNGLRKNIGVKGLYLSALLAHHDLLTYISIVFNLNYIIICCYTKKVIKYIQYLIDINHEFQQYQII